MVEDRITSFYSGGVDDRGRTLERILAWPDEELETVHDYIQWMFPTVAASAVNPSAPLVSGTTITTFRARPELRDALRRSLDRMLSFYGLRRTDDSETFGSRSTRRDSTIVRECGCIAVITTTCD